MTLTNACCASDAFAVDYGYCLHEAEAKRQRAFSVNVREGAATTATSTAVEATSLNSGWKPLGSSLMIPTHLKPSTPNREEATSTPRLHIGNGNHRLLPLDAHELSCLLIRSRLGRRRWAERVNTLETTTGGN